MARQANDLARSASTDPLTGLFNRRHFIAQFDQAMEIGVPGWFLIADIDYMKIINDRYGHLAGDEAVLATAKALETLLPEDSLIARIGGDEFCALIHGFQEKDMHLLSEQINTLAEQLFKYATKAESATLAVSMGYIACKPQQTFKDVMGQADKKLYRKKRMRSYHREAVN